MYVAFLEPTTIFPSAGVAPVLGSAPAIVIQLLASVGYICMPDGVVVNGSKVPPLRKPWNVIRTV